LRLGMESWSLGVLTGSAGLWNAVRVVLFLAASAHLTAGALLIIHLSRGMTLALDGFTCRFVTRLDSPEASKALFDARLEWTKLSAILRSTSVSLQWCFAALTATAVLSTFASLLDAWYGGVWCFLPGIALALAMLRVILRATGVTDTCFKLPSLFTTIQMSQLLEARLLQLVQFMHASESGFYVAETRVGSSTVLKFAYFTAAAAASFATQLV
ncbi:unnamed protein product, partial [Polarella glacialis]